jgi:hypothetical protein
MIALVFLYMIASIFFHFHLRRRIERGHPAGKTQEGRKFEG